MSVFNPENIADPRFFAENRLSAHSDHMYFDEDGNDFRLSLNGLWKFHYAEKIAEVPAGFEDPAFDVAEWNEIRVPGHMQMQGYGHPQYANIQYPWEGVDEVEPGEIPVRFNPTGSYVTFFTLPEEWKNQPCRISFQGVESGFAVWLNGHYVGYSEDSFTPSEFDLTPYLVEGENRLAVRVFRYTAGSWLEDQDFFRFSGIFRDVYLYTVPAVHVRDIKVQTLLNDACVGYAKGKKKAELVLDLEAEGFGSVDVTLAGEAVRSADLKEHTEIRIDVEDPHLWSAEDPYLYDVELLVRDREGKLMERVPLKIGFRRFEIRDHIMCLNGKRIVFRGVNRHEFTADQGRIMDEETVRKDMILMKQNNINAIRTSHYPNISAFYRLADELGFYIIDETNLETHGTWDAINRGLRTVEQAVPGDRPEYLENVLDRARSMYERDKNHACILIWSCGNESYGGKDIHEMMLQFHRLDPTRIVHYEGIFNDRRYPDTSDMESTMYASAEDIRTYLKEHRDKPYINCEYSHAMGNSLGAMKKYTDLTEEEPLFQGGFIWDYIDQSITCTDRYGREFQAYGGDFDDHPCDYSFSGDGIVYGKDRDASPKMQEVKANYAPIRITFDEHATQMTVFNKQLFTNTDAYDCVTVLLKNGVETARIRGSVAVDAESEKTFPVPVTVPADDGEYTLQASFVLKEDTAWALKGHEVAWGQVTVQHGTCSFEQHESGHHLHVVHGWHNTGVYGDDFSMIFSNTVGGLVSYQWHGVEYLKDLPKPNFWRAMTENDMANLLPYRSAPWKAASMFITNKYEHGRAGYGYEVKEEGNRVTVTYRYTLPLNADCYVSYTVEADGTVHVSMKLDASRTECELPECSMLMKLPFECSHVKWYGLGPEETYPDRRNAKLGIWNSTAEKAMAKYLVPQECGAHMDVRYAEVSDEKGHGLRFACNLHSFSALPYNPHEMDDAKHPNELPLPMYTYVRIGHMMGVGGDDTWGALVHPEYTLDHTKPMEVSFSFRGI